MEILALDVFIPALEVEARAKALLAKIPEIKDCAVELRDGGIVLRRSVGPFSLELLWQVSLPATNEVVAELSKVAPSIMGGATVTDALMKEIAKKIGGVAGIRVEGNALHMDAAIVLEQQFNIALRGVLCEISITREGVSVQIKEPGVYGTNETNGKNLFDFSKA